MILTATGQKSQANEKGSFLQKGTGKTDLVSFSSPGLDHGCNKSAVVVSLVLSQQQPFASLEDILQLNFLKTISLPPLYIRGKKTPLLIPLIMKNVCNRHATYLCLLPLDPRKKGPTPPYPLPLFKKL